MDLNVTSVSFGTRAVMAPKSPKPKFQTVSEKLQTIVKNASNAELLAGSTSASAVSEGALATNFPYVAATTAVLNSGLAASMFADARVTRKIITDKDSLIRQAHDALQEKEDAIAEKDSEIADLKTTNEKLAEEVAKKDKLLAKNWWQRIWATGLWS